MKKISDFLSKNWRLDYVFLFGLVLVHFVANFIWLKIDTLPPHWDASNHLMNSLYYFQLLSQFFHSGDISFLKQFLGISFYYPPFVYWLVIPWYVLFGKSDDIASLSNIIFIFILIFSTYGIGKKIWGRKIGLLSALLISTFPIILTQCKEFQLDFPLTAMVTLSFYLLLRTENFKNLKFSILFGIASGFGMLTKWTFAGFLIVPTILIMAQSIYELFKTQKEKRDWRILLNFGLSILIFFFVAGPWYFHNLADLKIRFGLISQSGIFEGDPPINSWPSFVWYFWALINYYFYLIGLIPLIFGLIFLIKKESIKKNWLLVISVVASYLIFTFFRNKDVRYITPILPFLIILATYWIKYLPKKIEFIPVIYFIFLAIFFFWSVNFGFKFIPVKKAITLDQQNIIIYAQYGYFIGNPVRQDWPNKQILKDMVNETKINFPNKIPVWLNMYYIDNARLNKENFKYYILGEGYPIQIGYPFNQNLISDSDYFLVKSSDQGKINEIINEQIALTKLKFNYQKINQYICPDGDFVNLFRVIK